MIEALEAYTPFAKYVALLLFAIAGYYDYKERKFPTILAGGLWVVVSLPHNFQHTAMAFVFGITIVLNALAVRLEKKPFLLSGDVLLLAPFAGYLYLLPLSTELTWAIAAIAFSIPFIITFVNKKDRQPFATHLAMWSVIAWLIADVLPTLFH